MVDNKSSSVAVFLACIVAAHVAAASRARLADKLIEELETETQIGIQDPFEAFFEHYGIPMTPGQGSPCGLKEYKAYYKQGYFKDGVLAATLEVGETTTTFYVKDLDKMERAAGRIELLNNIESVSELLAVEQLQQLLRFFLNFVNKPVDTADFRKAMCSFGKDDTFRVQQCNSFFKPANLVLVCPLLAGGVHSTISNAHFKALSPMRTIRDPLEAFCEQDGIPITPGQKSPCGLKGYKQEYFKDGVLAATLEVDHRTTIFHVEDPDVKMWTAAGFDENLINKPMDTDKFRQAMCSTGMDYTFKNGCVFFAPANLVRVCDVLDGGKYDLAED